MTPSTSDSSTPAEDECVVIMNASDLTSWCRKPVVGRRAEWRMCQFHYDLFDPNNEPWDR